MVEGLSVFDLRVIQDILRNVVYFCIPSLSVITQWLFEKVYKSYLISFSFSTFN